MVNGAMCIKPISQDDMQEPEADNKREWLVELDCSYSQPMQRITFDVWKQGEITIGPNPGKSGLMKSIGNANDALFLRCNRMSIWAQNFSLTQWLMSAKWFVFCIFFQLVLMWIDKYVWLVRFCVFCSFRRNVTTNCCLAWFGLSALLFWSPQSLESTTEFDTHCNHSEIAFQLSSKTHASNTY